MFPDCASISRCDESLIPYIQISGCRKCNRVCIRWISVPSARPLLAGIFPGRLSDAGGQAGVKNP